MLYNLFLPPRGVCHTATAVAVFVYVCTTNLLLTHYFYGMLKVIVSDDIENK